jgi:hypothetical protein
MGWIKTIISLTVGKFIIRPNAPGFARAISVLQKKAPVELAPPVAGKKATKKEVAAMKKKEEEAEAEQKQKKAKNDQKLVINGAKIQCTLCSNPMGTLMATHNTPSIQGQPAAVATDKGRMNLVFAGSCLKVPNTPVPCMGVIQPLEWQDTGSFKIQDEAPLLLKSTIKCVYGGVDIKITDCGQRRIFAYDAETSMEADTDECSQMRIALFFDGTRNNMKNTEAREEYEKLQRDEPHDPVKAEIYNQLGNRKDNSYENGYSNIAFLSMYYESEVDDQENLRDYTYIEGIATGDHEHDAYVADDQDGYAFAMGKAGIEAKVDKGCKFAAKKIKKLIIEQNKLTQITFEVFGFSRGAAAARSFLNEVRQPNRPASSGEGSGKPKNIPTPALPRYGKLGLELEALGVDITDTHIVIRFTGLFDTVSSYGKCPSKEKDTEIFGLDAVTISRNTLHLASADEHRHFFPLVNIKSTGFNEKTFPGVHSDIGGSYVEGAKEIKKGLAISTEAYVRRRFQKVVKDGWYTTKQLEIVRPSIFQKKFIEEKSEYVKGWLDHTFDIVEEQVIRLRGVKESLSVAYSYIPLHIMCDYAMQKGIYVKFKDAKLKDKYNIKTYADLKLVNDRLYKVVFDNFPELLFYSRDVLEDQVEDLRPEVKRNMYQEEDLGSDWEDVPINPNWGKPMIIEDFVTDKVLIQKIEDHNMILMLRGKYLHRSADWFEPGFNPTKYEVRTIWNG